MNKLIVAFLALAVLFTFIDAVAEGGGGNVATQTDGAVAAADLAMQVDDTQYFLTTGVLWIDNEKIYYANTDPTDFLVLTRGYEGTTAAAHLDNTVVYNEPVGIMNAAMGFDIAQTASTYGIASAITIPLGIMTKTLPRIATWDYGFLSGDMVYVKYFLTVVTVGCILYLAIALLYAFLGIFKR